MNTIYKKRSSKSLHLILFAVCFLFATKGFSQESNMNTWQEQLNYRINNAPKDIEGDAKHLKLIKYTYKGKIKSEIEKKDIIDSLLSSNAPFVKNSPPITVTDTIIRKGHREIREKHFAKFDITTIHEMMEDINTKEEVDQYVRIMKKELEEHIQVGFEYLKLEWDYKGEKIYSLCIVSNENPSIVFDQIAFFVGSGTKTSIEPKRTISNK